MLFKYLPPERLDVIENLKLRFTPLLSLNDPFEYSVMLGKHEYSLRPEITSRSEDQTKFVSLSRNHSNILMWSHYSSSHTGFCVGFHRTHDFFKKSEPIRYRKHRSSFNGALFSEVTNSSLKEIAIEKAIDWAYEEEERLFFEDVTTQAVNVGKDQWGQDIVLGSFPTNAIHSIYIGLRANKELIEEIKKALVYNKIMVPIYVANKRLDTFGLEFVKVST